MLPRVTLRAGSVSWCPELGSAKLLLAACSLRLSVISSRDSRHSTCKYKEDSFFCKNSFQLRDTIGISSLQTNCLELWSYDKIKNVKDWQMKV